MQFFKKSISLFLSFAMVFSFVCVPAYAVDYSSKSDLSFWDYYCRVTQFFSKPFGLVGKLTGYTYAELADGLCSVSDDGYHHASQSIEYGVDGGVAVCDFCGDEFTFNSNDLEASYSSYVSTLETPSVSSSDLSSVIGYSATKAVLTDSSTSVLYRWFLGVDDFVDPLLTSVLKSLGVWDKVLITGLNSSYLYGFCFLESGALSYCVFDNPLKSIDPSLFGLYDISDLTFYYSCSDLVPSNCLYYSMSYAEAAAGSSFVSTELYSLTFDGFEYNSRGRGSLECYYKSYGESDWTRDDSGQYVTVFESLGWAAHKPYIYADVTLYVPDSTTISLIYSDSGSSSLPDESTRLGPVMQSINNYNIDNSYTDNSTTVNYYLTPNNGDTLCSPVVFDESTKVFTVPETGQQFLCDYWIYHYTPDNTLTLNGVEFSGNYLGSYILRLADSSYVIGDTVVPAVWVVYMDEKVYVIPYYTNTETGNIVPLDFQPYSYAMVSQSSCSINGHTYTSDTTQPPTCSVPGERKYTCSVCGNEYVEDIPATGVHSYRYSVSQDPTCTADGVALYTCSVCGDQYTEPIPALGHSYKLIEYVAPEYDENGTAVSAGHYLYECSVCGNQYSETDEIPVTEESWFSWLGGLFKKAISAIVNGFASGIEYLLEHVIGGVSDFIVRVTSWAFNLFDGSALVSWFDWFSEDNAVINNEFAGSGAVSEVDVWAYSFG